MKTIQQIITELEQYDCSPYYEEKKVDYKGTTATFVPYHHYPTIFNSVCEGMWSLESDVQEFTDSIVVTCRISITGLDSNGNVVTVVRESSGSSGKNDSAYGGAIHKASAQALRRAAALFGLALSLWSKPGTDTKKSSSYAPPGKVATSTFAPATSNSPAPSLASLKSKAVKVSVEPKSEVKSVKAEVVSEPSREKAATGEIPDMPVTEETAGVIPF